MKQNSKGYDSGTYSKILEPILRFLDLYSFKYH